MSFLSDLLEKPASQPVGGIELHGGERSHLPCVRRFAHPLAGRGADTFKGPAFRWTRGSANSCGWYGGRRHWLALPIRRSFRWSTIRRVYSARPIDPHPRNARTAGIFPHTFLAFLLLDVALAIGVLFLRSQTT